MKAYFTVEIEGDSRSVDAFRRYLHAFSGVKGFSVYVPGSEGKTFTVERKDE